MTIPIKIFVVLSFIAAAFYIFVVFETVAHQGVTVPALVKTAMVVAFLYYGVSRIRKARTAGVPKQSGPDQG
jgi:hypothetical protein